MKHMMHLFKWLMLLTLLLTVCGNSLLLLSGKAQAVGVEQQILVDNNPLKVSVKSVRQTDQVHWVLEYEKRTVPNERFKLKLNVPADSQVVEQAQFERQKDWLIEKEFGTATKGTIELITKATTIDVIVQLDQLVGQTLTSNILTTEEAGPHTLVLPNSESETSTSNSSVSSQVGTSVNSTSSKASKTTSSVTEAAKQAQKTADSLSLQAARFVSGLPKMIPVMRAISDPFRYTTDELGYYAEHGINQYLGTNNTSEFLKNYHYGLQDSASGVAQYNLTTAPLSFEQGYHEYGSEASGRANLKKTIQPTATANQFKVQLDMIGDAIRPIPKIDVVLVLDKSGSMNTATTSGNSRWQDLQVAVNQFADSMLNDVNRDVQIGIAAFGSSEQGGRHPYGEIAAFDQRANTNTFAGFTNNKTALMNHALLTEDIQTSGTPTFLGVDAGLKLLTNASYGARADSYKVLITITDGEPTFSATNAYFNGTNSLDNSLSVLNATARSNNSVLKMAALSPNLYSGDGSTVTNQPTINLTAKRYAQFANLHRYAIGYHTGTTANAVVEALGPDGTYTVSVIETLVTALRNILDQLMATISDASVTDPLSQFVDFVPGTLKAVNLVLKNGVLTSDTESVQQPTMTSGGIVEMTALNLGLAESGRQGYRITYNVTLKEAYRNGLFYPANETTYLTNGNGTNMYFAIPSVRSDPKLYQLVLEKRDEFGRPLAGAAFKLSTKTGATVGTAISNIQGQIIFSTRIKMGDYVLTETQAPVGYESASQQPWTLSIKDNHEATLTDKDGQAASLTVTEQSDHWQITTKDQNGILINQRKPFDLGILKRDALTQKTLADAEFTLYTADMSAVAKLVTSSDGQGQFKNSAGEIYPLKAAQTYHIKETKAPTGYVVSTGVLKVVLDQDGQATVTKDGQVFSPVKQVGQTIQLTIDNTPEGGYLPATGGQGWRKYQYWALGLIISALILSGYYYVQHTRRPTDKK